MHNKVKNLKVTAWTPTTDKITKAASHGRICFAIEGEYTLEDGSKIKHLVTSERKKNLGRSVESEQRMASAGAVTAEQWSDGNPAGDYWMFCTRMTIGGSGLVPLATQPESDSRIAAARETHPKVAPLPDASRTTFGAALASSNARNGFNEGDCGGVLAADGHVYSDADPGL